MKVVSSSAALGTLSIGSNDLAGDAVLQLIVKLASSLQLTVKQSKKAPLTLELPSGKTLTQRNAIVRCLCGMGLHNALDPILTGGHMAAVASSPTHAMAVASMSSWMSVADHAAKDDNNSTDLLQQLEAHLETRAYLVPSATCTVADIDVAVVVLKHNGKAYQSFPNVHRWLVVVAAFLTGHGISIPQQVEPIPNSHAPPLFFYGTEENVVLPAAKKAAPPPPKKEPQGDKKKEPQQQAKKGEKPKKQQQQQEKQVASFDISALDIRVGKIVKVWPHPEAEKLFCEEIDLGPDIGVRQIASGLRPFYKTEELENQLVVVLCNLKKRNLVGFPSHGMVLCASNADHTNVEIMAPPATAILGERVTFGDTYPGDPEPENKVAKKKVFECVAPDLKTNAEGICVWKDATSQTSAGPIKASKGMPNAHVA